MSRRSFHELFPITSLLALLSIGFFIIEFLAHQKVGGEAQGALMLGIQYSVLDKLGAMDTQKAADGEVWRLLSCAFLHGGVFHIVVNMFWLVDLGRFCEPLLSSPKFFTVYLLCAIGASLGSLGYVYVLPEALQLLGVDFFPRGRLSVGASGAVAGLFGLVLVYSIKERHPALRDMLVRWLVIIVLITFLIPRVDHVGHAGGFLTGCLLGLTVKDYTTSRSAARWRYPSYAAAAALAAALGVALWNHFSHLFGQR